MTSNLISLTEATLSLGLAYVVHSTLLLIGVGLVLLCIRSKSQTLRERLWKLAVVVPLVTSPLQVWSGVAPIPEGWSIAVATMEGRVERASLSEMTGAAFESDIDSVVRGSPAPALATTEGLQTSEGPGSDSLSGRSSSVAGRPPVGDSAGSGDPRTTAPNDVSTAPSSGLRPPSPQGGEGTGFGPLVETEAVGASPTGVLLPEAIPVAADSSATQRSAMAELAPAAPTTPSTNEPRMQPAWPPTDPPRVPFRERASVEAVPATVTPIVLPSQASSIITLDFFALGIALAVLASLAGGLLLLAWQRVLFWRRLRKCSVVESGVTREMLDGLLSRRAIRRRVRLLVSDGFSEPVACGVLRWTIIVPHGVEQRLSADQIEGLLAHELAHLVRGDTRWLWVGNVVCSCLWFQPLNFLARRRWQQAAEFLADDWAVTDADVSPLTLAQCLTQIAEWRLDQQESRAILAAGGHRSSLSSRIDCLVQTERPPDAWRSRRRRRAVLIVALAIAGGLVWAVPRAEFVHAQPPGNKTADVTPADETQSDEPAGQSQDSISDHSLAAEKTPLSDSAIPPESELNGVSAQTGTGGAPKRELPPNPDRLPVLEENWQAEWDELQIELRGLNANLIRVAELLEKYPGDPRVRAIAESVRARAVSFEARRRSLDERLKASSQ